MENPSVATEPAAAVKKAAAAAPRINQRGICQSMQQFWTGSVLITVCGVLWAVLSAYEGFHSRSNAMGFIFAVLMAMIGFAHMTGVASLEQSLEKAGVIHPTGEKQE